MSDSTFEEKLKQLESIAQELESGNLTLDESISKFELGMKLSKECTKKLDNTEKKINILIKGSDEEYEEQEFVNTDE